MAVTRLERVTLIHPIGDMGDRLVQGLSTLISSNEWHVEADFHQGNIKDVVAFHNRYHTRTEEPPRWELFCSIPAANIKAYKVEGSAQPQAAHQKPQAVPGA